MMDFGFDLAGRRDPRLARGAILSGLGAANEVVPMAITLMVLDGVFQGTATMAWLPWTLGGLLASLVLTIALQALGGIDSFIATYSLVCSARLRLVDHLRRLPMGFWNDQRTGRIGSLVTDEFALYTDIATHVWSLVVANLVKPAAIAVLLLVIDWRLGLVAILPLPVALLAIPWSHRLMNRASDRLADTRGTANARLVEYIAGIGTLREHGQAGVFHERLGKALQDLERDQMGNELAPAPALFTYKLVVWLGFSLVMGTGALLLARAGFFVELIGKHAPVALAQLLGLIERKIGMFQHCACVFSLGIKHANTDGCRAICH